jgi:uncharacterized protein YcbK (DUF882 family)
VTDDVRTVCRAYDLKIKAIPLQSLAKTLTVYEKGGAGKNLVCENESKM